MNGVVFRTAEWAITAGNARSIRAVATEQVSNISGASDMPEMRTFLWRSHPNWPPL